MKRRRRALHRLVLAHFSVLVHLVVSVQAHRALVIRVRVAWRVVVLALARQQVELRDSIATRAARRALQVRPVVHTFHQVALVTARHTVCQTAVQVVMKLRERSRALHPAAVPQILVRHPIAVLRGLRYRRDQVRAALEVLHLKHRPQRVGILVELHQCGQVRHVLQYRVVHRLRVVPLVAAPLGQSVAVGFRDRP